MQPTAASEALALALQMQATKQAPTGQLQAASAPGQSPIAAAQVVMVWESGMPEGVDFADMPSWTKDSTPGNQTQLIDPNAIGYTLAYMSAACSLGVSLQTFQLAISQNPQVILSSIPNCPSHPVFISMMSQAGWQQSDDPFNVWIPVAAPTSTAQEIVGAVLQTINYIPANPALITAAVAAVAAILQPAPEPM